MRCGDAIESFSSEWFQSALTATISTTFNWLGILENRFVPSSPKLSLIAHGSEFAGQTNVSPMRSESISQEP